MNINTTAALCILLIICQGYKTNTNTHREHMPTQDLKALVTSWGGSVDVDSVFLNNINLTTAQLNTLVNHDAFTNVRALKISDNKLGDAGLKILVESPKTIKLDRLHADEIGGGDEGARSLASSAFLHPKHLILNFNAIGPEGASALANGPTQQNTTTLHLDFNPIGDEGAAPRSSTQQ